MATKTDPRPAYNPDDDYMENQRCLHCGEPVRDWEIFCNSGCRTAYEND